MKRLSKEKQIFGDDLDDVIEVCVEVFFFLIKYSYP